MMSITETDFLANSADVFDAVVNDREPVTITRAGHESVVMMSLDDYSSLQETAYLMRSPANARRLFDALERVKAGDVSQHELIQD